MASRSEHFLTSRATTSHMCRGSPVTVAGPCFYPSPRGDVLICRYWRQNIVYGKRRDQKEIDCHSGICHFRGPVPKDLNYSKVNSPVEEISDAGAIAGPSS